MNRKKYIFAQPSVLYAYFDLIPINLTCKEEVLFCLKLIKCVFISQLYDILIKVCADYVNTKIPIQTLEIRAVFPH